MAWWNTIRSIIICDHGEISHTPRRINTTTAMWMNQTRKDLLTPEVFPITTTSCSAAVVLSNPVEARRQRADSEWRS